MAGACEEYSFSFLPVVSLHNCDLESILPVGPISNQALQLCKFSSGWLDIPTIVAGAGCVCMCETISLWCDLQ